MRIPVLIRKRVEVPFWLAGGFGNKLRAWRSAEAFIRDGCPCTVMLRYISNRGGQGPCEYPVAGGDVAERVKVWTARGMDPERLWLNEMAPDHRLCINGELRDDWYFYHSRLKLPMREALRKGGAHMQGLQTRYTLQTLMTPASWSDLTALLELYPGHIVELSVYEVLLGDLRGRNTIVWEVRNY